MTKLIIIIVVVIGVVAIFSLVGYIIFRKFRKEHPVIKGHPATNNQSGVPQDEEEEYEQQYHPKAELGDFYGEGKKVKA
jgi:flagellar basal body-associated protein FliL